MVRVNRIAARGRTLRHGAPVRCADPAARHSPDLAGEAASARHGPLAVMAWARVHQAIHRGCGGWEDWPPRQEFPVIEGTLIRLAVTRPAPGYAPLDPMWLRASDPDAGLDADAAGTLRQAYLRRFDLERGKPDCCHKRVRSSSGLPSVPELVLAS